ncbi:MAG: ATP-binding protein [Parvibaculaceae bacterium]
MRLDSLAFRLTAAAGLWLAIVLIAGGIGLASLFRQSVEASFDENLDVILESLIATVEVGDDGQLSLSRPLSDPRFQRVYSGWYWQVRVAGDGKSEAEGGKQVSLRSRSLFDQALHTPSRSYYGKEPPRDELMTGRTLGPENQPLRVVERQVRVPGLDAPISFAVAGDMSKLEEEVGNFTGLLAGALIVMGLGILVALLIQVRYGLRPLERVRRGLHDIRTGEATRLTGDFPSEIEPLALELNSLLDYANDVLERARTHVGNLAHALKTPLSVLANESRRKDDPLAKTVAHQTGLMRQQIEHHLARARTAANARVLGASTPVEPVLDALTRTLSRIYQERNLDVSSDVEAGLAFKGEAQDLEEMVGNLLDNACKWAKTTVAVSATRADGKMPMLRIRVEDDGPGLPEEKRALVLERGTRLDEAVPGSGLGLNIVGETAELYGGTLSLLESEQGGLRAELLLPRV